MAAAGAGPEERARLDARAAAQHGLCTTADLRWAGFTEGAVRGMVRRGELVRLDRGVFRLSGTASGDLQILLAAILAAGEGAVASHRAAAWLWAAGGSRSLTVELTVGNPRQSNRDVIAHRRLPSPLDSPADRASRHGVPVTSPLVTVVQLGAVAPDWLVARTLDDFVGRKLVTITGVQSALGRLGGRGRRGAGVLRRVLEQRGLGTFTHEGALEPMLADLCVRFGLPMPDYQHEITLDGCRRRLDFAYPELRIAIEVDGYEFHSRYERFEDDRVRANALELAGWLVLRFTWHELVHRPDRVAATIRRAMAARAARGQAA